MSDLLILGDLAGRGQGGRASAEPLARRRRWQVDRDDLDDVIALVSPELRLSLEPNGAPVVLRFTSLDDFHPDRLVEQVPLIRQLRALRAELAAPARMAPDQRDQARTSAARRDDTAAALTSGSLLDEILASGAGDAPGAATAPRPADELSEFVRRAVQPHLVGEPGGAQRERIAQVDGAIAAALRVILHHPDFQALEAFWRGVDLVTRRVDTSESLHVTLADVTREELVSALDDESDAGAHGLRALLELPASGGSTPRWAAMFACYDFGSANIRHLQRLAVVARETGVPCIAAADPELAGARFDDGSDADDWTDAPAAEWEALRHSEAARWLGLALPRFLARVPYGARGEPCEVVPFEEIESGPPAHDALLWANPALLCAIVLGESAAEGEAWATQGTIGNLPFHVVRHDGDATALPCAEAFLSQRSVVHLLDRGLTALESERDGDSVRIPRLQSVAAPPARLAFASSPGAEGR